MKLILTYRGLRNWLKAQPARRVVARRVEHGWSRNCPVAMYLRQKTGSKHVHVSYYSYEISRKFYEAPEWLEDFLCEIDLLHLKQYTAGRCLKILDQRTLERQAFGLIN